MTFLAYQDFPARLGEERKYGVENTLSVLGDDAWCGVSMPCTVPSALSYLEDTTRAFHTLTQDSLTDIYQENVKHEDKSELKT